MISMTSWSRLITTHLRHRVDHPAPRRPPLMPLPTYQPLSRFPVRNSSSPFRIHLTSAPAEFNPVADINSLVTWRIPLVLRPFHLPLPPFAEFSLIRDIQSIVRRKSTPRVTELPVRCASTFPFTLQRNHLALSSLRPSNFPPRPRLPPSPQFSIPLTWPSAIFRRRSTNGPQVAPATKLPTLGPSDSPLCAHPGASHAPFATFLCAQVRPETHQRGICTLGVPHRPKLTPAPLCTVRCAPDPFCACDAHLGMPRAPPMFIPHFGAHPLAPLDTLHALSATSSLATRSDSSPVHITRESGHTVSLVFTPRTTPPPRRRRLGLPPPAAYAPYGRPSPSRPTGYMPRKLASTPHFKVQLIFKAFPLLVPPPSDYVGSVERIQVQELSRVC